MARRKKEYRALFTYEKMKRNNGLEEMLTNIIRSALNRN